MRKILLFALFALPLASWAAETVSWSWGCDDESAYSTYISGARTANSILGTGTGSNDMTFTAVTGASGTAKEGKTFLKGVCTSAANQNFFSTVTLPSLVDKLVCDSYTFEFDWAPSIGRYNDQPATGFGLAVHDTDGNALFTIYANGKNETIGETTAAKYIRIYKAASSTDVLYGPTKTSDLVKNSYDNDPASSNVWFHITLSGSSSGVTLAVSYNNEEVLSATSVASKMAVPGAIGIRTGCYSNCQQWFGLDDFSFIGTKPYEKIADYDFEDDEDTGILKQGCVASSLLNTSAWAGSGSTVWTVAEGTTGVKNGEKFPYISGNGTVMMATLPEGVSNSLTKATAWVVQFDSMTQKDYSNQEMNGLVLSGRTGIMAVLRSSDTSIYKGDSTGDENANLLASSVSFTDYNNSPIEKDCIWHRWTIHHDETSGTRLDVVNLSTGARIIDNAAMDEDIPVCITIRSGVHGSRSIYGAIDNIKVWTYRQGGFVITISKNGEETEKDIESEALKTWLGEYTPDAVNELAKPNASGISPLAAYLLGYATYNADQTAPSLTATTTSSGFSIDYDLTVNGEKPTIDGIALEYGISTSSDMVNWSDPVSSTQTPPVTLAFNDAGLYNRLVANIVSTGN